MQVQNNRGHLTITPKITILISFLSKSLGQLLRQQQQRPLTRLHRQRQGQLIAKIKMPNGSAQRARSPIQHQSSRHSRRDQQTRNRKSIQHTPHSNRPLPRPQARRRPRRPPDIKHHEARHGERENKVRVRQQQVFEPEHSFFSETGRIPRIQLVISFHEALWNRLNLAGDIRLWRQRSRGIKKPTQNPTANTHHATNCLRHGQEGRELPQLPSPGRRRRAVPSLMQFLDLFA